MAKRTTVCVRCGEPVKLSRTSRNHVGHEDARRDTACGLWAWKYRAASRFIFDRDMMGMQILRRVEG